MNEKFQVRETKTMPFDKVFDTPNGKEFCHATGYEIKFPNNSTWWNEYEDSEGNLYYGN